MERVARWQLKSDLSTIRERASAFLNNPMPAHRDQETTKQWSSEWIDIAEGHSQLGEESINRGNSDEATEAWLCALTAYEVARRLITESDQLGIVVAGIERCIKRLALSVASRIERVRIGGGEPPELEALYLRSGSGLQKQTVICISTEQEPGAILLGRLLPATFNRKLSLLIISHDDLLRRPRHEVNSSCQTVWSTCRLGRMSILIALACMETGSQALLQLTSLPQTAVSRRLYVTVGFGLPYVITPRSGGSREIWMQLTGLHCQCIVCDDSDSLDAQF